MAWRIIAIGGHDGVAILDQEMRGINLTRARRGVEGERRIEHEVYNWIAYDECREVAIALLANNPSFDRVIACVNVCRGVPAELLNSIADRLQKDSRYKLMACLDTEMP